VKNCDECEKVFQCLTTKKCWLHEEPVIMINNKMMPKGIEVTCSESLGEVLLINEKIAEAMRDMATDADGNVAELPMEEILGEQFAIYLYNCADEKWLAAMLNRFGQAMPPSGEEEIQEEDA